MLSLMGVYMTSFLWSINMQKPVPVENFDKQDPNCSSDKGPDITYTDKLIK